MKNTLNIQTLNSQFSHIKAVGFVEGKNGLPFIQVENQKASALISIYAGQVLSYQPVAESEDLLFISNNAYFIDGKAIKGGVPICWPWFGGASTKEGEKLPDHGFVRDNFWTVSSCDTLENGDTKIKLTFTSSTTTHKLWSYPFHLSLDIIIGDSLTLDLITKNTGDQCFSITEALHTYFKVANIQKIDILGLEKTNYLDKGNHFTPSFQTESIKISKATDHIYTDIKHNIRIIDPVLKRKITITSSGNKNVVVWNPWQAGSHAIADLRDEDYQHFICVEIANTESKKIEIKPNHHHRLTANYTLNSD
ncbi:MAG: D-hexose-6-phosphate mutarotase [Methylococcales bacterium]|nr:D-hexose-6-phosphate mutarotase [Methylococcales bacterium]